MGSFRYDTTLPGSPSQILQLLTEPQRIAGWAPVPFEVLELDGARLATGSQARVAGKLAGRPVEFDVDVRCASNDRLELLASGPIAIDVRYTMQPLGPVSQVEATMSVEGRGLLGRVLVKSIEALVGRGALRLSLERLARELQPALAA